METVVGGEFYFSHDLLFFKDTKNRKNKTRKNFRFSTFSSLSKSQKPAVKIGCQTAKMARF